MTGEADDRLFGANRFFTLPPGTDFLGELARTLLDITNARETPEALSDALVFVPNRRSAKVLAGRLFDALGGQAFLPPDIRPLGDAGDNDPALLGELSSIDIRPPMPPGGRIGVLTLLVSRWHEKRGERITLSSAMSVARDLARLLDQAALVGDVDWSELGNIVLKSDLAAHWQISVDFLTILTEQWPHILEEQGFSDTNQQDRLAAKALCARWERDPPSTPVLIVGSTGTSPSTRMLMAGAARLPRGAILFPGLDTEADVETWTSILGSPSHPQHSFAETLAALDVPFADVSFWPGFEDRVENLPRRKLIQESLAPADATADWVTRLEERAAPLSRREMTEAGLSGLSLIEAETEAEEADAIALLLRQVLEDEGKTAALVTPDAGLSRRVSALLEQWNVHVAPSSGWPLLRTPAGSFLLRVLDFVLDPGDPVTLTALLKHDLTICPCEEGKQRSVSLLERGVLRGLRRWETLDDLYDRLKVCEKLAEEKPARAPISRDDYMVVEALVDGIRGLTEAPLGALREMISGEFGLRPFIEGLAELADTLSREPETEGPSMLWSGEDGAATARFLEDLALTADWLPEITHHDLRPLFTQAGRNINVADVQPSHPRLFIWGPLEARLQTCDLMILGSLNESKWPEPPAVDGFLPRHIRSQIGLPDTEARIGLSAHDFAQLACSKNVVLTRSKRVENKPSVASRWLWRLRILASGALESLDETDRRLTSGLQHVLDWSRQQHGGAKPVGVAAPEPKPPAYARPKQIRVTDVQRLIRDPYAYYGQHVLKLQALDPLNTPLGPREIGIAMHEALENRDTLKEKGLSVEDLLLAFETELETVGGDRLFLAEREAIWNTAASTYHRWLIDRDTFVGERFFEKDYAHEFDIASGRVKLYGRADLVEVMKDGTLAITDYKTGKPPSNKQVKSGLEPQLPLLAVIAELGTSSKSPKGTASQLFYFGLGTSTGAQDLSDKGSSVETLSTDARDGFLRLMEAYAQPSQPFLSGPRVKFLSRFGDYDRLARRSEWGDAGAEPGGDA